MNRQGQRQEQQQHIHSSYKTCLAMKKMMTMKMKVDPLIFSSLSPGHFHWNKMENWMGEIGGVHGEGKKHGITYLYTYFPFCKYSTLEH